MTTDISNIKQEFFLALRLGIGRAYLMAKRFRHVDFTEEIIKACIKNYAYDGQIEDSRAEYLYELINLSERKDEIVNAVLKHLSKRQSDTWTLVQLFDLAKLFAQEGNGKAKKAIYDRYLTYGNESSAPWAGYSQILDLDGFEGLLFIAQKEGELLSKDNDYWVDDNQIQYFQTDNPFIRVKTRLRNAAKNNVYIQLYLDKIQETENNRSSSKRIRAVKRFTYNYIKKRIDQNSFRIITEEKANELTEKEVIKLAKEFLAEKSDLKKEQYLRFFAKRKFPYGYNELLLLAKRKTKKDESLKYYAILALRFFEEEEIRTFALHKLNSDKPDTAFINLLTTHYKKGDEKLLLHFLQNAKDQHDLHDVKYSVMDVLEKNPEVHAKDCLQYIYNNITCSLCREGIVNMLIEKEQLNKQLQNEIKYDCNKEIRALHNKHFA